MLFIVSTTVKNGKGGISTALVGFCANEKLKKHGFRQVTSHDDNAKLSTFLSAAKQLWCECKPSDDVWLHCGPWLSLARKWMLSRIALWRGANIYFHLHSPRTKDYLEDPKRRKKLRWLLKDANGIFVLTPWWKTLFDHYLPELSSRITVLPNPLDPELDRLAREPLNDSRPAKTTVNVLAMARLIPEKGVAAVLASFPHLPDNYKLSIAGEGPQLSELQAQAFKLGLMDRVTFLGWVDYEKKSAIMAAADVFCLPSRYDSFGMAYVEAMALGKPVVALRREAIPDVVADGVTGCLIDSDDPMSLANAIKRCYEHRDEMGRNGKDHVVAKFDADNAVTTLLAALADSRTKQ